MLRLSVDLPHVKQEADWDCGLACCSMVLQQLLGNKYEEGTFQDVCRKQGFGTSVWTVDIASILTAYNVNYMFFTKTLGADSSFRENSFYQETFEDDESRVNRLFEMAPELNIKVEKRALSLESILSHLAKGHVAIVLVNSTILQCAWCGGGRPSSLLHILATCCSPAINYCGHFVVLCGFDKAKRQVFYKNPSFDEELCCATFEGFDFARQSHGTDEDIIFIRVTEGFIKDIS